MARLKKQVVEWSLLDHYPNHWGAAMSVATVTSALRSYEFGVRETWVDLLAELLEGDPHAHAVLKKTYSYIANADYELALPELETAREQRNAQKVVSFVRQTIESIPNWSGVVYRLAWGHLTGASAAETIWGYNDGWFVRRINQVPSRRIAFDDYFRPYITESGSQTTGELFESYPGKFIVFLPVVTGDMPTREGLGRIIAYWLAFKRWATRDYVSFCERFGKPTPVISYKTNRDHADEDDLSLAENVVEGLGRGSMPGAWIPDTLDINFADAISSSSGSGSGKDKTVHQALIDLCNNEISKAVLGNTLTTEVGATGGNRALGQVQSEDQLEILSAIAKQLDEVITRDLVSWIVRLNFGDDAADRYTPRYCTKLEEADDLVAASEVLERLVGLGLDVAKSDVYARFGWPAPNDDEELLSAPKPQQPKPTPQPSEPDDAEVDDDEEDEDEPEPDTPDEDEEENDGEE